MSTNNCTSNARNNPQPVLAINQQNSGETTSSLSLKRKADEVAQNSIKKHKVDTTANDFIENLLMKGLPIDVWTHMSSDFSLRDCDLLKMVCKTFNGIFSNEPFRKTYYLQNGVSEDKIPQFLQSKTAFTNHANFIATLASIRFLTHGEDLNCLFGKALLTKGLMESAHFLPLSTAYSQISGDAYPTCNKEQLQQIAKAFPETQCLHLKSFGLNSSCIDVFSDFKKLKILQIQSNDLSGSDFSSLPASLVELSLAECKLKDENISQLKHLDKLTALNIPHNKHLTKSILGELPKSLQTLNYNPRDITISEDDMAQVPHLKFTPQWF